jgi:RNA polymerase sigma-70 factor, ECF subfamily
LKEPRNDGPSDAELMERFGAGDDEAFRLLVERHERALLGFFWRRSFDRAVAEDCTQEVFLRLVRHRGRWRPDAKFTTYMYRIAENHWIDRYRSMKSAPPSVSLDRTARDEDGWSAADLDGGAVRPEKAAGDHELAEKIRRAIGQLPEGQRAVFSLAEVEGMDQASIADVLGIPLGTVKSRMHTAVARLRQILAEEGHDLLR